jgi:predicted RecA/RadA family phage recombinase
MAQNYIESGEVKDHVLSGTVASGAVVEIGDMVGVALGKGVSGDTVSVALEGVFEVPKVTGSGKAFTLGQKVYSKGDGNVTPDATDGGSPAVNYKLAGYAWIAASTSATTVQVKLLLS